MVYSVLAEFMDTALSVVFAADCGSDGYVRGLAACYVLLVERPAMAPLLGPAEWPVGPELAHDLSTMA